MVAPRKRRTPFTFRAAFSSRNVNGARLFLGASFRGWVVLTEQQQDGPGGRPDEPAAGLVAVLGLAAGAHLQVDPGRRFRGVGGQHGELVAFLQWGGAVEAQAADGTIHDPGP